MDHPLRSNGIIVRFSILMGILLSIKQQGGKFPELVQIHETPSSKSVQDAVSTLQTTTIGTESEDEWKTFTKTIDTLENPVFAIDKTGVVIIWNKAIEQLTGVPSKEMVGKGNREYAIPFFGEPRPMLVDYIVISTDKRQSGKFPGIKRMGNTFIGEMEKVKIREKPMFLWGKGTAVHDEKGVLIAAIETIAVVEQQQARSNTEEIQKRRFISGGYQVLHSKSPGGARAERLLVLSHHLQGVMASMQQTSGCLLYKIPILIFQNPRECSMDPMFWTTFSVPEQPLITAQKLSRQLKNYWSTRLKNKNW